MMPFCSQTIFFPRKYRLQRNKSNYPSFEIVSATRNLSLFFFYVGIVAFGCGWGSFAFGKYVLHGYIRTGFVGLVRLAIFDNIYKAVCGFNRVGYPSC